MRKLIALALIAASVNSYALRCGNTLVDVGSSLDEVLSRCNVSSVYHVHNNGADIVKVTINEGSIVNTLTIIDGTVKSIDY